MLQFFKSAARHLLRFLLFLFLILLFTGLSFLLLERTPLLSVIAGESALSPSFHEENGRLVLRWQPFPYPCLYKVEVFSKTTGIVDGEPEYHVFLGKNVKAAETEVPHAAIPVFYRITAYGTFGKITADSPIAPNPDYAESMASPMSIYHYDAKHPASLMPFLVWHVYPGAVCYELELLSGEPDSEGGTALSLKNHLESTRQIYTNGWQADLRKYQGLGKVYYRVRALDLHLRPLGEFSKTEPVVFSANLPLPNAPLLNDFDQMPGFQQPLYPVYHWIPMHGIMRYEVQLFDHPPAENDPPAWRKVVTAAADCYDEYPRLYAGDYYWRVRAVNEKDEPLGTWSETAHFIVRDHTGEAFAALGDSITHGGGSVSLPPSFLEYSYTTYLDVPCYNLGKSGDTSHMTLERFDTDVLPLHPKNLFILTGSNSLRTSDITAQDVIDDLQAIRQKCENAGIRPIFLTLPPLHPANIQYAFHTETDPHWAEKMKTINAWVKEQPSFIDLEPYFYDVGGNVLDTRFAADGLHPDIRGKMLMAEVINRWLAKIPRP